MIKILAIDDRKDNLIALNAIIKEVFPDAAVFTSQDGAQGIELAISKDPDLILLDVVMPGMDGFEVCRWLKQDERLQDIPVVFLTAVKGAQENRIKALESGAEAFLAKPIDQVELIAQINAMVKIREANRQKRDFQSYLEKEVARKTEELVQAKEDMQRLVDELRESEEYLRFTKKSARAGLWDWDMVSGTLKWSEEMFDLFGLTPSGEKPTFEFWDRALHPDDREGAYLRMNQAIENRIPLNNEYRVIHPNGKVIWINALGDTTYAEDGKPLRMAGICLDITDRIRREEEIRRYASIVSASKDMMAFFDKKLTYLAVNEAYAKAFSLTPDKILGLTAEDILGKEFCDQVIRPLVERCIEGAEVNYQKWYDFPDNPHRYLDIHYYPFRNPSGEVDGFVVNCRDITQNRITEVELIEAKEKAEESNRLKTAFLANMSHEIRTPMNAIMGFSSLLPDADEEEKNRYAAVIQKSSKQLLTVLNDVIFLSRLQSERLPVAITAFRPADLISDVYQMFDLPDIRKGIEFTGVVPDEYINLKIDSDEDKIKQVLISFVSNALRYTQKGFIRLGFDVKGDLLEFFVEDTGMGIRVEEKEKIFDNFYRSESAITYAIGGTGLGLTIAKQLIELLGSKITLVSELDKGSRFSFSFSLEKVRSASTRDEKPVTVEKNWKDLVILIAEDEPDNFMYLEILLRNRVKRIDHAENGEDAIRLVSDNKYHLILMDIKMPGIDGTEAIRRIKKIHPKIPIIAQTAFAYFEERDKVMSAGCDGYLSKPIKKNQLIEMINRYT